MEASCRAFKSHQRPSNFFDRYGSVKALVKPKNIAGSLKGARWQKELSWKRFKFAKFTLLRITVPVEKYQERTKSSFWHGRGKVIPLRQ
jgi:hypothetical protein